MRISTIVLAIQIVPSQSDFLWYISCIIVDSTRRGKRLPDALSKTIPIWCAALNRAISKSGLGGAEWDAELHTLPSIISRSEHAQIAVLIDGFADNLLVGISQNDETQRL